MKSTTFFLKSTKAVFALVVVMMTSTALMSCSKDDGTNADNGKEIVDPKKPEEPETSLHKNRKQKRNCIYQKSLIARKTT